MAQPAILQFLMADISFNIACKELKIAQIAQLNQLFRMLMRKNVNNDVSKDSPIPWPLSQSNPSNCIIQ